MNSVLINDTDQSLMLDLLWEYQLEKGFISRSDIHTITQKTGVSNTVVEGVISFYHFFSTEPTGKHTIYLNRSILSELAGFKEICKVIEKETGAKLGSVDDTGTFGFFETSCIGMSDQEPAALIDFHPVTKLTPAKIKTIIDGLKEKKPIQELADPVLNTIRQDLEDKSVFFRDYKRGDIAKKFIELSPDEIIEELKWSGLSGRGGAFFPTGLKWQLCKNSFSKRKFIICNADEGEPGTFKDRQLLTEQIGLLIEGMLLASYTVDAYHGIIYLRAEYRYLLDSINKELAAFRKAGLLGTDILGIKDFNFDIRVQLGAGAYICGEETALIESLEGKRGEPRTKTFFPVEKGYKYKPTVVNNVETFCAAARIIEMGAPVFRELGSEKSSGAKLLSVAGDCERPGIYEIEWGMTIKELLKACGAKDTFFVQMSGPSGVLIPKKEFHLPIGREGVMCGGSVMIFNKDRDLWDVMINFSNFFIAESCGLCTPCRAGNFQVGKLLRKIRKGEYHNGAADKLRQWAKLICDTSRCGLGKTSNNFILDVLHNFPEVIESQKPRTAHSDNGFNLEESQIDYSEYVDKVKANG
jgi:[NiFe] hydrogenase diaphorase moiety large subunit